MLWNLGREPLEGPRLLLRWLEDAHYQARVLAGALLALA